MFIRTLYESDYFIDISVELFEHLNQSKDLSPKYCNSILGLLLGAALSDQKLIRTSILNMLTGHDINL